MGNEEIMNVEEVNEEFVELNNDMMTGVYTRNGEDFEFHFIPSLPASKKIEFVNSVVETLVDEHYNYIIKDLVFDYCVITLLTDVDTLDVVDSKRPVDAMELFVHETNIVEIVESYIGNNVFDELRKAVDLDIEFKTGIHRNPIAESLSSLLNTIENKISDFDLGSLTEISEALSNVTGELTPENLLTAYANSDIMKKRYQELLVKNNADKDKNIISFEETQELKDESSPLPPMM